MLPSPFPLVPPAGQLAGHLQATKPWQHYGKVALPEGGLAKTSGKGLGLAGRWAALEGAGLCLPTNLRPAC